MGIRLPVKRMVRAMTNEERPAWAVRLEAERERSGWNKRQMARRLLAAAGYDVTPSAVASLARQVRGWERGDHFPRDWTAHYAVALDMNEAELFAGHRGVASAGRDAFTLAASVILARRPAGPVAPELADYFRDQLAGHYAVDRHLGPLRLIPTAVPQYELLCELASAADGPLRPTMWALAAGYAAFIGWLYQDGGDVARSVYWHDVMIERSHRSLDPQLVAFALHNKAMLHADMLDGRGVVDLARAALVHEDTLTPKVRILALQQLAHGTSLVGGQDARDACDRLLDQAAELIERIDDPYPWGSACQTPHYVDVQRATCLLRLDRAGDALDVWDRVMPTLAAGARRDLGVFRARQAQALALRNEPDKAVEIAAEVVGLAAETGSVRMKRELRGLAARMRPWAQERPGRELGAMLATMGDHP